MVLYFGSSKLTFVITHVQTYHCIKFYVISRHDQFLHCIYTCISVRMIQFGLVTLAPVQHTVQGVKNRFEVRQKNSVTRLVEISPLGKQLTQTSFVHHLS
jgi:hypothetical protein